MDSIADLGSLALGSRLKRLSDSLYQEVAVIYSAAGIQLQPGCFPLFYLLHCRGPLGISQAAEALGVSHAAVSKMAQKMMRDDWLEKRPDPQDERCQVITLSQRANELLPQITPLWREIRRALDELLEIEKPEKNLLDLIAALEDKLEREPFAKRVLARLEPGNKFPVRITGWSPRHRESFRSLNQTWLDRYFPDGQIDQDQEALNNPEGYYLARGGAIFFAVEDRGEQPESGPESGEEEAVGTCALARLDDETYQISKMAVCDDYQKQGIGRRLILAALAEARHLGARRVTLESNRKLEAAIRLYQRLGFREEPHPNGRSDYPRADIFMALTL